jgi:hypothetical protein
MIDIKIQLRQKGDGWEQVACTVELRHRHVPVLDIPAREDETFPTKEQAIATLKERVTFELQQNHRHESGSDVRWQIEIYPTTSDT